jgi:hypothetical protein
MIEAKKKKFFNIFEKITLLIVLASLSFAAYGDANYLYLKLKGEKVNAIVFDKNTSHGKYTNYFVKYKYVLDNTEYVAEDKVSSKFYKNYSINDVIQIVYSKHNLKNSYVDNGHDLFFTYFVAAFLSLICIAYILKKVKERKNLQI